MFVPFPQVRALDQKWASSSLPQLFCQHRLERLPAPTLPGSIPPPPIHPPSRPSSPPVPNWHSPTVDSTYSPGPVNVRCRTFHLRFRTPRAGGINVPPPTIRPVGLGPASAGPPSGFRRSRSLQAQRRLAPHSAIENSLLAFRLANYRGLVCNLLTVNWMHSELVSGGLSQSLPDITPHCNANTLQVFILPSLRCFEGWLRWALVRKTQ